MGYKPVGLQSMGSQGVKGALDSGLRESKVDRGHSLEAPVAGNMAWS